MSIIETNSEKLGSATKKVAEYVKGFVEHVDEMAAQHKIPEHLKSLQGKVATVYEKTTGRSAAADDQTLSIATDAAIISVSETVKPILEDVSKKAAVSKDFVVDKYSNVTGRDGKNDESVVKKGAADIIKGVYGVVNAFNKGLKGEKIDSIDAKTSVETELASPTVEVSKEPSTEITQEIMDHETESDVKEIETTPADPAIASEK